MTRSVAARLTVVAFVALIAAGCTTTERRTGTGALIGAGTGAVIGGIAGGGTGAAWGAGIGAVAGGAIGAATAN
ncbi:YMGG-like glycine zipper-containing protein [Ancylobacter sp. IITR112]|uniref:YMGG-like glycine zipper-containing protein n=1 Tax=Ancylobacter sp. IITR112 TaxID=3138073 RepID=UPI00352A36A4